MLIDPVVVVPVVDDLAAAQDVLWQPNAGGAANPERKRARAATSTVTAVIRAGRIVETYLSWVVDILESFGRGVIAAG